MEETRFKDEQGDFDMQNTEILHVYSSNAVAPPIKKCAEEFKAEFEGEFRFTVDKAEIAVRGEAFISRNPLFF